MSKPGLERERGNAKGQSHAQIEVLKMENVGEAGEI